VWLLSLNVTSVWSLLLAVLLAVVVVPVNAVVLGFAAAGLMHAYVNIMNFVESKTDFLVGETDGNEPAQEQP
jgi:hypothetical protein